MACYFVRVFDGRDLHGTLLSSHIEARIDVLTLAQTWAGLARNQIGGDKIILSLSGF